MVKKPIKVRKPVFYPILPRQPREKRGQRDKQGPTSIPCNYQRRKLANWVFLSSGTSIPFLDEKVTQLLVSSTRSFVSHPDYRKIIAQGGDATFPYVRVVANYKPITYAGAATDRVNYRSDASGTVHGGASINPLDPSDLQAEAMGKLKNRLSGYVGNAQLAAPLAESREIHRLVRQINDLGMSTLRSVLAIKKTKGKSAAKQFADVWLGFGFGVNPLLHDIQKGADSILKYMTRQDQRVRVVGTATREYLSSTVTGPEIIAFGCSLSSYNANTHTQGVRIVAGIDLQTRSAASYSVLDHLGLKISEVPSVLWELTPFSWVVDYGLTVSPWLDDMFYTLPGVCKYVSRTTKYQLENWQHPKFIPDPGFTWGGSGTTGRFRYISISRDSLVTLPSRPLQIKTADQVAKYGVTKLLNLASVIAGKHGGPRLTYD